MEQFVIEANESYRWWDKKERTCCLNRDTFAFYHSDYQGGGNWTVNGTIENLICTLKNDRTPYTDNVLSATCNNLYNILCEDLPQIIMKNRCQSLTVCVIPRAKHEEYYSPNQLLFRHTIQRFVTTYAKLNFIDGTHNIIRHTDTKTTHSARSGNGGDGSMPYPGITNDTCHISNVRGKDILLIDDLYTKHICIDEDAIQALYDNGANNVIFYSIGKTIQK